MAVPLAAAIPLAAYAAVEPLIPAKTDPLPASAPLLVGLVSIAGVPILVDAWVIGWGLYRRRWGTLAAVMLSNLMASAIIAAAWLWFDRRAMAAMEHYGPSGWYLAGIPGAYAAAVLILIAWEARRAYRWLTVRRRAGAVAR